MPHHIMKILHIFMYLILVFIALDTLRLFLNQYKKKQQEAECESNVDI